MPMPQFPPLIDSRIVRPTETALALGVVSDLELLRLKALARWYARGLPPDVTWEDLLQESVTRILLGKRAVPQAVAVVAFVAGVMRSLRSEHWQRIKKRTPRGSELIDPAAGPERALIAQQELAAIQSLFADDAAALTILEGLAGGLTADEIRDAAQLSDTEYASARKRMRRVLLREGLTCTPK
jgi:DNA-directed RNA polymerase specialized sigma24 family protein